MAHDRERGGRFARLAVPDSRQEIEHLLDSARELLDMDIDCTFEPDVPDGHDCGVFRRGALRVPLRLSDGRVLGSLRCSSRNPVARPLAERDERFMRVLARLVVDRLEPREADIERQRMSAEAAGVRALLAAVEARDGYTGEHCRTVADLSMKVARRLGLTAREIAEVQQVALLHDVGKVAVPDEVLQKRGALTTEEVEAIEAHPETGARIVRSIAALAHLAGAIRACHEHWDGSGYPDGLRGHRIPLLSRITLVCDAYDAMTSDRPYRKALTARRAVEELERNAGRQFCSRSVHALIEVLEDGVELYEDHSGRLIRVYRASS